MTEFEFTDEIPGAGLRGSQMKYLAEAAACRAEPGRWLLLTTRSTAAFASTTATSVKAGNLAAFRPPGSFEAAARTVDGEYRVYVRYVGEGS